MDVREKLVELICRFCSGLDVSDITPPYGYENLADFMISNGVTVQEDCKECAEATQNCIVKLQEQIAEFRSVQEWISVNDRLPQNFVSVLGYMTDAGEFPPVRECYTVGNVFFFPALGDIHPVSHWREMPKPPKGE